jgi:hypothetical protein
MIAFIAGKKRRSGLEKGTPMMMNSFRTRAAICAAGAAVVAALTAGTAIAGADANDDAFAAAYDRAWTIDRPSDEPPPPASIASSPVWQTAPIGRQICSDLGNGTSPDQIAAALSQEAGRVSRYGPTGLSLAGANFVIAAAKTSYCP